MDAFFQFGFLQRALVAGVFIAVACSVLGVFLVLRKDAMVGHGMSHVAFAGVALGLFLGVMPLAASLIVSIVAALGITKLKESAGLYGDTAIGIISSLGLAVGILLATMAGSFNVDLLSYLFGEILAIEPVEVVFSMALAAIVIGAVAVNYSRLLFMTFDREAARAVGLGVARLDALLTVMTAVTIVLGMKVVGILLVAALIVIPAAAGLQAASSFRSAMIIACAVSMGSVAAGLFLALAFNIPASASIVILSFLIFLTVSSVKRKKGFFRR